MLGASAGAAAPLVSATSTAAGSWVVLPMGQLSDPSNTFWQLAHVGTSSAPSAPRWSVVTPPGAADNGGLAMGVSAGADGSVLTGVLPNGLLRFSPISLSGDSGTTWHPLFLPGGLAARPDSLAYRGPAPGTAVTLLQSGRVLQSGGASSWAQVATATSLRRKGGPCAVTTVDAVGLRGDGTVVLATGCRHGEAGVFVRTGGTWAPDDATLPAPLDGATTAVLRLEADDTTLSMLVSATSGTRKWLDVLSQTEGAGWTASTPFALPAHAEVRATSLDPDGHVAALLRTGHKAVAVGGSGRGGGWARYPSPPQGTVALAPAPPGTFTSYSAWSLDAFIVHGTVLDVYAQIPAGAAWAKVQSLTVPLSYGSSSGAGSELP